MNEMPAGIELDKLVAANVVGYPAYGGKQQWRHFSTDMNAAWEVADKALYFLVAKTLLGFWECQFTLPTETEGLNICRRAVADTAPLAICRAALIAVDDLKKHEGEVQNANSPNTYRG